MSTLRALAQGVALLLTGLAATGTSAWAAVRYVAPAHPQAEDSGIGTEDKPYRSIAFAMTRLMPGDVLRIAGGTYREALILPNRAWSKDKPTVIEGDEKNPVILLGTDRVDGWEAVGKDLYVVRAWAEEPQQVWVGGTSLTQIGGTIFKGYPVRPGHELAKLHRSQGGIWPVRQEGAPENMPPGSFLYDAATRVLYLRTGGGASPGTVEVATRPFLIHGENVAGIEIRNLHVRYASTTTTSRQAAVTLNGHGNTLENVVVEDVDGVGVQISGDDNMLRNSRVVRSGFLGIKARGQRVLIENNEVSHNNTRGFNKWWEAGGMKFVGSGGLKNSRVVGNRVHHNYGDGIWFDWGNPGNAVERNLVAYNQGFGIHYEAGSDALIVDNQVFGNRQRGIYLPHTHGSWVAHNLVVGNGLDGIVAVDEGRNDPKGQLDLRARNDRVVGNVIAWNKGAAVILPGENGGNLSNGNLFVDARAPMFSMGWPRMLSPKMNLADWRKKQGQDRDSRHVAAGMSEAIRAGLQQERLDIDWSALNGWIAAYALPAGLASGELPASIVFSGRAGPR